MARKQLIRHTTLAVTAAGVMLLVTGCNQVRGSSAAYRGAPGLDSDGPALHVAHNVAEPNGPFALRDTSPRLSPRPVLLDINGVPDCNPEHLNLFESQAQANGVHHTLRLTIANTGEACRLGGFPSISLMQTDGTVLGQVRVEKVSTSSMEASLAPAGVMQVASDASDAPSPLVLLPVKGEVAFRVGWTSGPDCIQAARIAVSAPGSLVPVMISRDLTVCEDRVMITAVGSSDSQ